MVHLGDCVNECPAGYLANFHETRCISEDDLDLAIVYFPFMGIVVVALAVNIVGQRVKPTHRILTNFLIMLATIEHAALITQIVFSLKYGTIKYFIPTLLVYIVYVATNPVFHRVF